MKPSKIHRVLFYKPIPEAINCMVLNKSNLRLAIARSDFSIQIWNLQNSPHIERVIPSTPDNNSIEGLTWCGDRLFSVSLHGFLVEYDLFQLTRKQSISIAGEQAYCLDASPNSTKIAVGTDKGYINLFTVEGDVLFDKFLDKQEGRIICLKYDPSGNFIVSGGEDVIRVWDVISGHALHKMTTGRSHKDKITIIWCLQVLSDLTVVSGDSRGILTFWDGRIGSQLTCYRSHKADILSLCTSDDEKTLYCAGVDPAIICYVVANIKENEHKWIKSIQIRAHEHDVKSLVLCGNKLYSGGINGYLTCSYYPPNTIIRFPPLLNNCARVCSKAKYLVLFYGNYLEVWMLGKHIENTSDKVHEPLALEVKPKRLLILKRTTKNSEDQEIKEGILCYSMSDDGKWIVFSTDSITRLWKFSYTKKRGAEIVHMINLPIAVQCYFTEDGTQLVLALRTGKLEIYSLMDLKVSLQQTIETMSLFEDTITFITGSYCGSYLIAGDCKNTLVVWMLDDSKWKQYWNLPKHGSSTISVALKPVSNNLVCVYSNHEVYEYDLKLKSITPFSKILRRESLNFFSHELITPRNITFDPKRDDVILLHDDSNLYVIDPDKVSIGQSRKHSKHDFSTSVETSHKGICNIIKKFKHNAYTQWLNSEDELVVVQVDDLTLAQQLPPSKKWKKYGTM